MQCERWRVEARMMMDASPTTRHRSHWHSVSFFLENGVAILPRVAQQLFIDQPTRFNNPTIRTKDKFI